ncbi:MAG: LSM domain-containing protein [Nanoarchaeota archaeon]
MEHPRPLDTLNAFRGKEISVDLRNGKTVTGKLLSFDLTINLGIEVKGKNEFVKGETVVAVYQLTQD